MIKASWTYYKAGTERDSKALSISGNAYIVGETVIG